MRNKIAYHWTRGLGAAAALSLTLLLPGFLLGTGFITTSVAQDAPEPPDRKIKYSRYPEENFPNQVFFGDTHLHTGYSTDAGMVGCTLGPEDAYRFARGETVTSSHGLPARLQRPYDFLVVSDHSENLCLAIAIAESNPELLKNEWGKMQHDLVKSGIEGGIKAYDNWMVLTAKREDPLKEMTEFSRTMWQRETPQRRNTMSPVGSRHSLLPDIEFHEDIRLLVYRPRGLLNEASVDKIVKIVGDLETRLKEPFNRFFDTLGHDEVELNFRYVIHISLHRVISYDDSSTG